MMLDNNASHLHSLELLELLDTHTDFMSSVKTVADMGAGIGKDAEWWATRTIEDDEGRVHERKIKVLAVDNKTSTERIKHKSIKWINKDFSDTEIDPGSVDMVWSHNSFQYSKNPLGTLAHWWDLLPTDGMLCLTIPYVNSFYYFRNQPRVNTTTYPGCYFNYSPINLIMLLASSGFDCLGGHFKYIPGIPWIHAAVYKTADAPQEFMNWWELIENRKLPPSIESVIKSKGYASDSDIIVEWIDHSIYNISLL